MPVVNSKKTRLSIGIIGAGPAGSMLAYHMSTQGHNVQLLERKALIERKICGEYLCPKGVELLSHLSLLDKLCSGFDSLYGMVLVSPDNDIIPSYFPKPSGSEKGLSVNRQVFDQRLLQLAVDHGAILRNGYTVTAAVKSTENKWLVKANDETFEFDLLIAADGRQSKVGHLLGHIKQINTDRVALHCYLPRKIDRGQRLGEMHILDGRSYCGLDPISDDEVNFSIVCDSERLKHEKPKDIINQAIKNSRRLSSMFDPINKCEQIRTVSSLRNKNSFIAGNDLAYVGDAAGFIDPLTGEGIYNALLSSTILAECLNKYETTDLALEFYKKKKKVLSFQKNVLNHFFQFLIRRPVLIRLTVKFLKKSPERANSFIGIIGNIYNPVTGFIKMLKA